MESPVSDPVPRDGEGPATPAPAEERGGQMSLLEHLDELRSTLIAVAVVCLIASAACWFLSRPLLDLLVQPLKTTASEGAYFHQPVEAFLTRLKLAFACGAFLVLPYVLYRIYGFVNPGLYARERRVVAPLLASSTLLFYGGVAFAYLILIPKVVTFLLGFGTTTLQPLIGVGPYFAFVARLCLAFGLVFQLPLVVLLLSLLGLVNPRVLLRGWRIAVLVIVVGSAALTPPDAVSQLLMAVPVALLYISSVLVAMVVTRRREARGETDED